MLTKINDTIATQVLTSSGTSAASTALTEVNKIRIATTTAVHIAFGTNPTATTGNLILPDDSVETFTINPGDKIAVIQVSSGGKVSVTPIY